MDHPWTQMWKWTLCVLLCGTSVGRGSATPHYMVAIPAVLESGAETKFCASLLQPNESLLMTVTLGSQHSNITLLEKTSSTEFNECFQFQVPLVQNEDVQMFEVQVRGDTFSSEQARKVMIKAYKPRIFIQTDKPIYLPGQTVHFRVVSLDSKLRSASMLYNIIQLEDSRRNRIGQWLNETSNSRILQLSYSLNSEAHEGLYKITVQTGEDKKFLRFEVEKYVLPKFDVTMHMNVWKGKLDARVCAQYTYRQPVPASITLKVCRPPDEQFYRRSLSPLCETKTKQTDMKGCGTFHFNKSVFHLNQHLLNNVLYLNAAVEEDGTGISHTLEKMINLVTFYGKLSFLDAPKLYEKGSNVEGKVKAVDYDDRPFPHLKLLLFKEDRNSRQLLQNLTTDSNGVAAFSISTDKLKGQIKLSLRHGVESFDDGIPSLVEEELTLSEFLPPSPDTKTSSSLELKKNLCLPCDQESEVTVKYTIVGEAQGTVDVFYLVLSRGAIVMQGKKQIVLQDKSVNDGEVSFSLTVSADMAPEVQVVAYAALPSEAVIAHSSVFTTEKCFSNKVSLEFSPSPAVPAKEIKLQLTAQPNSVCGVSAIDQSVLIKKPGHTLDADKIFNLLPVQNVLTVPSSVEDQTVCSFGLPGQGREEANRVFLNMGLKMATNLVIQNPSCLFGPNGALRNVPYDWNPLDSSKRGRLRFNPSDGSPIPPPVQTVRTFFPETWIWDLVEVGPSGTKDVSLSVPDTITTWETETFCLSPQGFGLAPRQKLTVFQPFFLELTLPYSIIRGENFELKATVFNYLTKCIMMKVTAAPSSDYTLTPLSGDQYTSCLCANERKTLSWSMNPTALGVMNVTVSAEAVPSRASCENKIVEVPERGRIDTVTRSLRVEAEGSEIVKTQNWLLCPKGEPLTEETEVHLPENVIDGSARVTVSVLGDILGRALKNLEGLLYGCGEQNMALLAPNIYILHYLKNTQQLTPAIKEKAVNFLSSGYQRQLNYKDNEGAYSTFGRGPGNTWLTSFVLRSFFKAQSFIYIDPENIEKSRTWLNHQQQQNGCFRKSGKLFNNRMKGGVSDEVTLSAYITAAFLEMNISANDLVVERSLLCLKESINDFSNTYTTALLAYVFTLAGDMETRAHLLQHLDSVAIKDGSSIHWSQTAAPVSVEISSYVLLAKLSASTTAEDLVYASRIVRWLTTRQNQYGGFSSTQDTVVALQALSLYSSLVFSPEGSSTVTVQSPSGPLTFDVTPDNKLFYQEKMLQGEAGKYSLEVKGTGCASVQISHQFNIPIFTDATTLRVKVEPEADCSVPSYKSRLNLRLQSLYSGNENTTNMVIVDIRVLTGFTPDSESLKKLRAARLVDHVEQKDNHVLMYLQELQRGVAINHSLELKQELPVQNLKPAVIKIYDYYQPSDQAETEYSYPCAHEE
ncbi:alpha-2-macroglobulin-like [Gambusia affinis]|uniref:alpha-2-macroglobulin-like n=1 Tax=Gambusia affinis TaxID=33528 RepID=UPI001CDB89DF|nr:alpha-2-macroglobulin-like [Gambusia affinis]XP_043974432.1 alpha-2-macroglobulin-like [Gambusia affinis]